MRTLLLKVLLLQLQLLLLLLLLLQLLLLIDRRVRGRERSRRRMRQERALGLRLGNSQRVRLVGDDVGGARRHPQPVGGQVLLAAGRRVGEGVHSVRGRIGELFHTRNTSKPL